MTDEPANIVLEYLRRFDRRLDNIENDVREMKGRMSSVGESLVRITRRLDRLDERVERIEKRLDLVEH